MVAFKIDRPDPIGEPSSVRVETWGGKQKNEKRRSWSVSKALQSVCISLSRKLSLSINDVLHSTIIGTLSPSQPNCLFIFGFSDKFYSVVVWILSGKWIGDSTGPTVAPPAQDLLLPLCNQTTVTDQFRYLSVHFHVVVLVELLRKP